MLIARAEDSIIQSPDGVSGPEINEFPFLYSCNGVILKPVLRLRLDLTCFIDALVPTHLIKPLYHKVNNENECEICACSLPLYTNISLEKTLKKTFSQRTMIPWQDLTAGFCFEPGYFTCFCAHNVICTLQAEYKQPAYLAAHSSKTKE